MSVEDTHVGCTDRLLIGGESAAPYAARQSKAPKLPCERVNPVGVLLVTEYKEYSGS